MTRLYVPDGSGTAAPFSWVDDPALEGLDGDSPPSVGPRTIESFCHRIAQSDLCLSKVPTEVLAVRFRRYFRLPPGAELQDIVDLCRSLGISGVAAVPIPPGIGGLHVGKHDGPPSILLNSSQWEGVHPLTALHEIYEIMEGVFHDLYPAYRRLHGRALEVKANHFAACVLLHGASFPGLPWLFSMKPHLLLLGGDSYVPSLFARLRQVVARRQACVFIQYVRRPIDASGTLTVKSIWEYQTRKILPLNGRKLLRSLLPKRYDPVNRGDISSAAIEYQGPVMCLKVTGLDLFGIYDMSFICLPVFTHGEISNLLLVGVKAGTFTTLSSWWHSLLPRPLPEQYQRV